MNFVIQRLICFYVQKSNQLPFVIPRDEGSESCIELKVHVLRKSLSIVHFSFQHLLTKLSKNNVFDSNIIEIPRASG